jgi:hypothetical protein
LGNKGGFQYVPYREIASPPSDKTAALTLIRSVIERHVGRLEELLAEHEEIEADEADERYDRAALDCSTEFARHRRYQSTRHRELMRTLETFRKMRKEEFETGNEEFGMRNWVCGMENEESGMADGKCQMADDRVQMANERCDAQACGYDEGQNSEPMTEGRLGQIVGQDSNLVIVGSTNDKIGILSHEGTDAADRVCQADGVGQCIDGVRTPKKAPNKPNFESNQSNEPQILKSETSGAEGRKQSQSPKGETRRKSSSRDGRAAQQRGRWPVVSEAEGCELLRAPGVPPLRCSDGFS